jgi:hypothetical protein
VDEVAPVSRLERAGHLRDYRDGTIDFEGCLRSKQAPKVRPVDMAHGDVEHALRLPRVVDRDHVLVVDARGHARLPQEALAEAIVLGKLGREDLERHLAVHAQVLGQIDDGHPAPRDERLDPVAGKFGADAGQITHPGAAPSRGERPSRCARRGV